MSRQRHKVLFDRLVNVVHESFCVSRQKQPEEYCTRCLGNQSLLFPAKRSAKTIVLCDVANHRHTTQAYNSLVFLIECRVRGVDSCLLVLRAKKYCVEETRRWQAASWNLAGKVKICAYQWLKET